MSEEEFAAAQDLEARLERIERAIRTMANWLSQTPDSFGVQDVRGIERILDGSAATEQQR